MAEFGGYMYASVAPLSPIYVRPNKTPSKTPARANSTSQATSKPPKTHHRFRHNRTSSSSSTSRSSHDTSLQPSSSHPAADPPSHQHHPASLVSEHSSARTATTSQPPSSSTTTTPTSPTSNTAPATPKHSALADLFSVPHYLHFPRDTTASTKLAAQPHAFPQPRGNFTAADLKHVAMVSDAEAPKARKNTTLPFARTESVSSASGAASLSNRTMTSSDPASSLVDPSKPFVLRNGRTYLSDPTLAYPLPVDLTELHRQSLRTLLLIQVFGGPVCSPNFATRPPARVLEVGCGSGFWSMSCHRYFAQRGHSSISFTGIDVAPLAPGGHAASDSSKPDRDMRWKFVQHDMRQMPWPLSDGEFDLVMVKDLSLATTTQLLQPMMDEYLRLLRPGGTLEIWESDHQLRMLRPHVPETTSVNSEEHDAAASLGAYIMTANTPLSAPLNNFIVEYNTWLNRALESRDLSPVPCTIIGPQFLQESDLLADVRSRRLAIPLSEVRWEREGVGGVVTKDGKSYIATKGKNKGRASETERKSLTPGQAALRMTAMTTVVQLVQSLEPMLREVSGKSQDEWDGWMGKMMNDLMKENGTSWGECLEVGAWWAKRKPPPKGKGR